VPKPGRRALARAAWRRAPRLRAEVGAQELVMGPADERTFAALRGLRSEIARAEQVPAYVVFPDRTLAELAVRRPRTLAAMGEVRGIGTGQARQVRRAVPRAARPSAEGDEAA
jgi:ATP-dependent DNA helicase RecQ